MLATRPAACRSVHRQLQQLRGQLAQRPQHQLAAAAKPPEPVATLAAQRHARALQLEVNQPLKRVSGHGGFTQARQ